MFSGNSCARVASGEAAAAKEPTLSLIRDAWTAIESLPAALFEKHAQHRPCGLLDQYEAVAMLRTVTDPSLTTHGLSLRCT